jgi:hypothetical protein
VNKSNGLRRIIILLVAVFVIAIGLQAYSYFKHRGLVAVNIEVLPSDSTLTVDSVATKPGKMYLTKGTHHLEATRQDFDKDSKDINTNDLAPGITVFMLPHANSQAAKEWLAQRPDVQRRRESAGGAEAERNRQQLLSKYPIIGKLPYENLHFKVDYSLDNNNKPSFTVSLFAIINKPSQYDEYKKQLIQYKNEALIYLQKNGIESSKFTITFIPAV